MVKIETNPTPMDIIMRDGLSGEDAMAVVYPVWNCTGNSGLTIAEMELLDVPHALASKVQWCFILDTIISVRMSHGAIAGPIGTPVRHRSVAKEENAEGPDLEAANDQAAYLDTFEGVHTNLARSYLQVLKELETLRELHRPRRTEDGEWPEHKQRILVRHPTYDWWIFKRNRDEAPVQGTWLPAPPKPEGL